MERLLQFAQAAPRAALAGPLLIAQVGMVLVLLALLGPAVFLRRRAPFERLVVILELVLGRTVERPRQPPRRHSRSDPPSVG